MEHYAYMYVCICVYIYIYREKYNYFDAKRNSSNENLENIEDLYIR